METCYFFLIRGDRIRPLAGILSAHETPEWLRELVTRAYINKVMSNGWVKYHFWLNYPFK